MDRELFEHYLRDETPPRRPRPTAPSPAPPAAPPAAISRGSRSRSRTAGSPRSASTPRAAARPRRHRRRRRDWSTARRCSRPPRLGIDDVEPLLGGLTPAKRHAAQLAADALHRALSAAAACASESDGCADLADRSPVPRRAASPSPCPAASTAPSPRCSNASAGAEVVGGHGQALGRPRDRRRQGLLLAGGGARRPRRSPTRSASRTSRSTSRRNSAAASSAASSPATPTGETPNPCVLCNGEVRIAAMIDLAERLGADRLRHRPLRAHRRGRRRAAARRRRRRGQGPELHARGAAAGAARPARASR